MSTAQFNSPIPYPESDAMNQAPVKWTLGNDKFKIRMRVPLFSHHTYQLFSQAVKAITFQLQTANGIDDFRLDQLLSAKETGMDTAGDLIKDALFHFKTEFGYMPDNLVDLLMAVSFPEDPESAMKMLDDWMTTNWIEGMKHEGWDLEKDIKGCMRTYCMHTLNISDTVLLLDNLQKVNTEFKKKLEVSYLPQNPHPQGSSKWVSWRRDQHFSQMKKKSSKTSP